MSFYPLTQGNQWTYKMKDGNSYTNEVTDANGNVFIMKNSMMPNTVQVKKDGEIYYANYWDNADFHVLLKDDLTPGEKWDVKFKANGLDNILAMTVKETGLTKEVNGTTYSDVIMVEAESKILMNGNIMPLNYFTQYYYANNVGLIMTTSSAGDEHVLTEHRIG